jgi:ADP-heptose:LPS heptosyltransferase
LLDPEGGASEPAVIESTYPRNRTRLTRQRIDALRPLLLLQPYIHEVTEWTGQSVDHNLDLFRRHIKEANLADAHLKLFNLDTAERDRAWLSVPDPIVIEGKNIVINRTVRSTGHHGFWESALPLMKDRCIFVGLPKEHEIFQYTFECEVPYYPTESLVDLARVIAGCRQFIGNSSFCHAIAEAMKKPLVLEMARICNVRFNRDGAEYI